MYGHRLKIIKQDKMTFSKLNVLSRMIKTFILINKFTSK